MIFTNFSAHVACGRGLVLLQGDEIPRGRGGFRRCPGHSKALAILAAAVAAMLLLLQRSLQKGSFNRQ